MCATGAFAARVALVATLEPREGSENKGSRVEPLRRLEELNSWWHATAGSRMPSEKQPSLVNESMRSPYAILPPPTPPHPSKPL